MKTAHSTLHNHRHVIKHESKTSHNGSPAAQLSYEMAVDGNMESWFHKLESEYNWFMQNNPLLKERRQNKVKTSLDELVAERGELRDLNQSIDPIDALSITSLAEQISVQLNAAHPQSQSQSYIKLLYDPIKRELSEKVVKENELGELDSVEIRQLGSLQSKQLENRNFPTKFREEFATTLFPIGLGWRSIYEYHFFIALYFVNRPDSKDTLGQAEYYLPKLKQEFYQLAGDEIVQLCHVFLQFTRQQYEKFHHNNVKPYGLTYVNQVVKRYKCSYKVAELLIELLKKLPQTPAEDYLPFRNYLKKKQWRKQKTLPQAQLDIIFSDSHHLTVQWAEWVQGHINGILEDSNELVKDINRLESDSLPSRRKIEEDINAIETPFSSLSGQDLDELTDQFFAAANDDYDNWQLLSESNSQFSKYYKQLGRLKTFVTIHAQLKEQIKCKLQLAQYIVQQQQPYLKSGDLADKTSLTKSDVVRGMGFLTSSSKAVTKTERELRNSGQNMERYMRSMTIKMLTGETVLLADLLTDASGIKVNNKKVNGKMIKQYIHQIIAGENKQRPLTDKEIQDTLFDDYGYIEISLSTIKKYRKAEGIENSRGRKVASF